MGLSVSELADRLKRSDRSARDWLSGAEKLPWWVPELLRLQQMEKDQQLRQMNIQTVRVKLGLISLHSSLWSALATHQIELMIAAAEET